MEITSIHINKRHNGKYRAAVHVRQPDGLNIIESEGFTLGQAIAYIVRITTPTHAEEDIEKTN